VARRKLAARPPKRRPTTSKRAAASTRPSRVGTITIATIIAIELRNDAQKSSSPKSSIQLSKPMNSGGRMPRYSVKLR